MGVTKAVGALQLLAGLSKNFGRLLLVVL
eukprot:COSAG01_NODE_50461_length_363_cov_0.787879_1_plen_28_part_10